MSPHPPSLICAESIPHCKQQLSILVTCLAATVHAATKGQVTSCDDLFHTRLRDWKGDHIQGEEGRGVAACRLKVNVPGRSVGNEQPSY